MKNLQLSALLDIYGQLLTDRQRQAIEDYYNFDLSLSEIAANYNVSRQAVCALLKAGERALNKYESALKLYEKSQSSN